MISLSSTSGHPLKMIFSCICVNKSQMVIPRGF
jgi:hypothetical protein